MKEIAITMPETSFKAYLNEIEKYLSDNDVYITSNRRAVIMRFILSKPGNEAYTKEQIKRLFELVV